MVLQTWINHLKCKNDWKWITYLDDSIWYGGKIRTDYIGSTSQRRVLCDWAFAYSVESLHRVNPRHISGTKTLWEYFGNEWGDAQMRTLCNLQRNCRTLVASKGRPARKGLHSNWQHKELNKELTLASTDTVQRRTWSRHRCNMQQHYLMHIMLKLCSSD